MKRLLFALFLASFGYLSYGQCPPASPLTTPYSENFDAETAGYQATYGNCFIGTSSSNPRWEYEASGAGNSTGTGPLNDASGTGIYAYLETSGGALGDSAGLIMPQIDLSGLTNPELRFKYHMFGATMGELEVYADSGNGWVFIDSIAGQQQTAETDCWLPAYFDLSTFTGSTVRIKFVGYRGSSFTGDISIDEIEVDEALACPIPLNLTWLSSATTTAELTFDNVPSASSGYKVYVGTPGFNPATATPQLFTNDTVTLTGLSPSTTYEAYVESDCGANGVSGTLCSITFQTNCIPFNTNYTRNFDIDADGAPAQCWTEYNNFSTSAYARVETLSAFNSPQPFSGTNVLEMYSFNGSSTDTVIAISPEFSDLTSNSRQIKFQVASQSPTNTLLIGTVSSQAPGAAITWIDTITNLSTAWQLVILPMNASSGYNGADKHIVFGHGMENTFNDIYIDDFVYEAIPACPQLTNITLSSVGITNATFTYSSGGNPVQYEWGPVGYTQGTGTVGSMTSGTGTVAGLSSASCYDIYLRTDCSGSGNGTSVWSGPFTVCTLCLTQSLPYSENFDIGLGCFIAQDGGNTTDTWVHVTSATTTSNPAGLDGSPGWVEADSDNAGSGAITMDETLLSPYIDASSITGTLYLEFDQFHQVLGSNAIVDVWDGTSWVNLQNSSATIGAFGNPDKQKIDITAYANDSLQVRFVYKDNGSWAWWYLIDNVLVQEELCARSTNFQVAFSTADSLGLSWDPGAGTNFSIEYGTAGFAQGAGTIVSTTDSSITITGLSAQTAYDFYLIDSCSGGVASLPVFTTGTTSCALTTPAVLPIIEGFENYTAGPVFTSADQLCNPSYSWTMTPGSSGQFDLQAGTAFYRNGLQAMNIGRSTFASNLESNDLVMTVDLSNYTTANGIELSFYWMRHTTTPRPNNKVYARGSVSDPWIELASMNNSSSGAYDSIIGMDIVAPLGVAGQTVGATTQLRWVEEGQSTTFSATCCDGFTLDDIMLEAVACPLPGGLNVGNVFDTTATLNWAGASSAANFQYWFGPSGFYQGTTTTAGVKAFSTTSGVVVDTLSPFTCYEFLVRTVCQPGDTSSWSAPFQFCTPCSPISAPYTENWDALSSGSKDVGCFSSIEDASLSTSTFQGVTIQSSTFNGPISSPNYVEMDNGFSSPAPLLLVSPPTTDMTAGDKRVVFFARSSFLTTPTTDVVVGTMSSPGDANTFSPLDTIVLDGSVFTRYVVDLTTANGYNGTDQFFAFAHSQAANFRTLYIDDVVYEAIPSCPEVSNLATVQVDSMNAVVTWTPFSGSTGTFEVEVGSNPFGSAANSRVLATNDTTTLTGLTAGTNQCFWVREICAPGDTSIWIGPSCFKTECLTISAPYFENFDGLSTGLDLGCFNKYEDPTLSTSAFNGVTIQGSTFNQPNSAPNVVELDNGSVTNNSLILVSPRTNDLTASDKRVRFFARTNSTFNVRTLIVGSMGNPLDSSTFNPLDTIIMQSGAMLEYIVNLDAANGYNGTDDYFAFAHGLNSTFQTIFLDDINYEAIPTCVRPDSLDVNSITTTTASVSWAGVGGGTNFQYEYGINPLGDPGNAQLSVTGSSVSLSGLTSGTGYCVWVREICSPGDTSFWRGPFCFSTLCATSNPAPYFTNFEGISIGIAQGTPSGWENCWTHVQGTGTVRWESEDATGANENSFGTGPFNDATTPTAPGGTYMYLETSSSGGPSELISPPIDITGVVGPEVEYWYHMHGATMDKLILYAEDATGTRTAIDSLVGQQQPVQSDPFLQRNVSISSLAPGIYSFVFEGYRGTSFTGDMAIDDFSVKQGASCPRPTFLVQTAKNLNDITVDWTANGTGTTWEVEYGVAGFTQGSGSIQTTTTHPVTITSLLPATQYDVYVREICGPGDTSVWTGPLTAETDLCLASDKCWYVFDLLDTFGDGWNGAEITIYQNGIPVGTMGTNFTTGTLFTDSIQLCNNFTTAVGLTAAGGWPSEIGLNVFDPTGASAGAYVASGLTAQGDTLVSFTTNCAGAPAPCVMPDSIWATNNVGCDEIEVDWNSNTGGSILEYGPAGFTPGSGTMTGIVTAPYMITNLTVGTAYDVYVADTCGSDTSAFNVLNSSTASGPLPVASFTIDSAIVGNGYEIYVDGSASTGADTYEWNFGNGVTSTNPIDTMIYLGNGGYTVTLIVSNACGSDTMTFNINVNIGIDENPLANSLNVYPNPASYSVNLNFSALSSADAVIRLLDAQGREVRYTTERAAGGEFNYNMDVSDLASGMYMIEISSGELTARRRLSVK
ncbi:MAG: PKD domain-containing protein [Bacteroidetes bacterium]|nr:PKD domain-containing protein [Bacteroidota bacterium]